MPGPDVRGDSDCSLGADLGGLGGREEHGDLAEGLVRRCRPEWAVQVRVLTLARTGEALVAVGIGAFFAHQPPRFLASMRVAWVTASMVPLRRSALAPTRTSGMAGQ